MIFRHLRGAPDSATVKKWMSNLMFCFEDIFFGGLSQKRPITCNGNDMIPVVCCHFIYPACVHGYSLKLT